MMDDGMGWDGDGDLDGGRREEGRDLYIYE